MALTVPVCADPQTIWSPIGMSDLHDDEVLIVSLYRHWKISAAQPLSEPDMPLGAALASILVSGLSSASVLPGDRRVELLHENGVAAALETVFSLLMRHDADPPVSDRGPVAGHAAAGGASPRGLTWAETGLLALLSPVFNFATDDGAGTGAGTGAEMAGDSGSEAGGDKLDPDLAEALLRCRHQLASLGIDLHPKVGAARPCAARPDRSQRNTSQPYAEQPYMEAADPVRADRILPVTAHSDSGRCLDPSSASSPASSSRESMRGSAQNNVTGYVTAYVTALSIA